jgi:hypothetical protein
MAMDEDFSDRGEPTMFERKPSPMVDPLDELMRILGEPGRIETTLRRSKAIRVSKAAFGR